MSTRVECPFTDCRRNRVREGELSGTCKSIHIRLESIEVDCEDDSEPPVLVAYCLEYQKPSNESHESTVDEIKRYRSEYADQGNEEAKP